MPGRVYPNAPLQLVAFELKFDSARMNDVDLMNDVAAALGPDAEVELGPPLLRADAEGNAEPARFRVVSQGSTTAVSLWRQALVLEDTDYLHFQDFEARLTTLLAALYQHTDVTAVQRVGLRFVDEIHLPSSPESANGWEPYLHPALLWPTTFTGRPVSSLGGGYVEELGEGLTVTVRTALLPGRALKPDGGPLVLRSRPDTPAFLLDSDGALQPPEPIPMLLDEVMDTVRELHEALGTVFKTAFTDRARDEIFQGDA